MASKIRRPSGGPVGEYFAGEELTADHLAKYDANEKLVVLCDSEGEEADFIVLETCPIDSPIGPYVQARTTTGIFEGVAIASNFTAGGEWMVTSSGAITAYAAAADKRPLGKFLSSGLAGETGKISFYSK